MGINFTPLSNKVTIGGNTFTVTALPLGVVRRHLAPLAARFTGGAGVMEQDVFDAMLKFTHMSVSKADPGITVDDLENGLMLSDFAELFQAVMSVSGMTRRDIKPGEASRQPNKSEAGETSTGTSQAEQGGHIAILTPS